MLFKNIQTILFNYFMICFTYIYNFFTILRCYHHVATPPSSLVLLQLSVISDVKPLLSVSFHFKFSYVKTHINNDKNTNYIHIFYKIAASCLLELNFVLEHSCVMIRILHIKNKQEIEPFLLSIHV